MNLFNEYENKALQFITKYTNYLQLNDAEELTEDEINKILFGENGENYTPPEIADALFNRFPSGDRYSNNLMLFYHDDSNRLKRIMENANPLPAIPTTYENYWLDFILNDPKAELFISPAYLAKLKLELSSLESHWKQDYFDYNRPITSYSDDYIRNFKTIVSNIKHHHHPIMIGRRQSDGANEYIYETNVFPYKIKYSASNDNFSLLAWNIRDNKLDWIVLDDSLYVNEGELSLEDSKNHKYEKLYITKITQELESMYSAEPIRLCIYRGMKDASINPSRSNTMADDRFAYLFSDYNRTCYEDSDGNLIADISYYEFQYNEVLSNILSLGKYAKVLSPASVVSDVVNLLKKKASHISS